MSVSYSCQVRLGVGFARTAEVQVQALADAGLQGQVFAEDSFWDPGTVELGPFKDALFDSLVASHLNGCKAFHGWNNAALNSIRTAKSKGGKTVVERQSSHISVQKRLVGGVDPLAELRMSKEYEEADVILVPSRFVEETFLAVDKSLYGPKLRRIPLAVDVEKFHRVSQFKHALRVLFVGQNFDRKGGLHLVKAWELARKQSKAAREGSLWLVGDSPVGEIKGINPLGSLAEDDYVKTVMECDMLVLPSLEEGFGLVVLEAMACLPPFEQVLRTSGESVQINSLVNGDSVFSQTGDATILETYSRHYSGDLTIIHPTGMLPFSLTADHPVLICPSKKGDEVPIWKPAGLVNRKDFLVLPRERRLSEIRIRFEESKRGRPLWGERGGKQFLIDENLAWLFGFYVGDGYSDGSRVVFCLSPHDTEALDKLRKIIRNYFDREAFLDPLGRMKRLVFVHKGATRLFRELFGTSAQKKRIPPQIMLSDREITMAFVRGYLKADGWFDNKRTRYTADTASRALAIGFQLLMAKIGVFVNVRSHLNTGGIINGRKIANSTGYTIAFPSYFVKQSKPLRGMRVSIFQDHIRVPVKYVSKRTYEGPVFNIQTSDGTFGLPCVVHNCGKPVIVSENVGARDCLSDGREGYIVPVGDPVKLAKAIVSLADSPDRRMEFGEQAHRTACRFTWKKYQDSYLELVRSLL